MAGDVAVSMELLMGTAPGVGGWRVGTEGAAKVSKCCLPLGDVQDCFVLLPAELKD